MAGIALKGGHYRTDIISDVGHLRSDSVAGALALYYKSLKTSPTLLRRGNILGRPYMIVMTYN
jgi:hypothetical protein